jgi:Xaa-Pro aminopeptidase
MMWSAVMFREGDPIIWGMDKETSECLMPGLDPLNIMEELRLGEMEPYTELWAKELKDHCIRRKIKPKKIAIDAMTISLLKAVQGEFPDAEIVDGHIYMMMCRSIKTIDEIRCLVAAYMITAAGMEKARIVLKEPGIRECEVLGEAYKVMYSLGSEWVQCSNIVCSGDYTYPYRRFTSDRIIQPRDLVVVDIGGRFNGYYGDFTRTFFAGDDNLEPTKEQKEIYQRTYDALRRVEQAAKPGNTTADLWRAATENCVWGGFLGHGLGIGPAEYPPLNKESINMPIQLCSGMVFSVEPYVGKQAVGGVRLEDNFVITEDGCAVLGPFPHDPRLCNERLV